MSFMHITWYRELCVFLSNKNKCLNKTKTGTVEVQTYCEFQPEHRSSIQDSGFEMQKQKYDYKCTYRTCLRG